MADSRPAEEVYEAIFSLFPKADSNTVNNPFTLQDGKPISIRDKFYMYGLLHDRLPRRIGVGHFEVRVVQVLLVSGSGDFPPIKAGGRNDFRCISSALSLLQAFYGQTDITYVFYEKTDHEVIEEPELLHNSSIIITVGGPHVNALTAYLAHRMKGKLMPGFVDGISGELMGFDATYRPGLQNDLGLFNIVANPWNNRPSVCIICAGIGPAGTLAANRYFRNILLRTIPPSNNAHYTDIPGHILKALLKDFRINLVEHDDLTQRDRVYALEDIRGIEIIE